MKKKLRFTFLFILVTIAILFSIPNHIVWGGQSFQTVPTIGPSVTPTKTKKITATQLNSTQTPFQKTTATKSKASPTLSATISTVTETLKNPSKTTEIKFTETISAPVSTIEPENTTVVILPIVSNEGKQEDQPIQDESSPIPAFVFPLVVVILFVIIYLPTRLLLKKSRDKNSNQINR
ncbi:MAG: hypothetical protein RBT01_15830 [Anaerolineaceae bacterium]|jgi:hypothetical protein|nr:hypothetical protein [Anaerolineaceae bacterium]